MKKYDYVIIGAGTAGLAAQKEVAKVTNSYCVIDKGPLGTTCAREGCMPSKAFIEIANEYHARNSLNSRGLSERFNPFLKSQEVLRNVRKLRDHFTDYMVSRISELGEKLILSEAKLYDENKVILADETRIEAKKIIVAVGSKPIIPQEWKQLSSKVITSDDLFELEELPNSMAIVGLGPIGLELGQALSRLEVETKMFHNNNQIASLSDPNIIEYVNRNFLKSLDISFSKAEVLSKKEGIVGNEDLEFNPEKILLSIGRESNLDSLGLKKLGYDISKKDKQYYFLSDAPNIYIIGDANSQSTVLHKASEEAKRAVEHSTNEGKVTTRETPRLEITFSDPQIAIVGKKKSELLNQKIEVKEVRFDNQGRSIVENKNSGIIRAYFCQKNTKLLGAELFCHDAEYFAHFLAWVIQLDLKRPELKSLPYYHPTTTEKLRDLFA